MRCRDLATAPSTSRGVWSAPACWRCGRAPLRPETSHPAPAFHKRPDGLLTRLHCPFEGRIPPGPDGNDSIGGPGSTRAKGRRGTHPSICARRLRGREAHGVRPLAGALASRPASQSRTGSVRSLVAAAMSRMRTGDCEPADGGPVLKAVVTAGRGSVRSPFVRQAVRLDGRPGPGCGTYTAAASRRSPCAAATSPRRLRGREALGVRQLAGAFGPLHCARRPTTPLLPSTNDQMGCSPDYIAHSRAGFHPGPCPGAAASHRTPRAAATPSGASDVAQGIKCAPPAKFRKKSLSGVCAGKLSQ